VPVKPYAANADRRASVRTAPPAKILIAFRLAPCVTRFLIRTATLRDLDVLVLHRRKMWEALGESDRDVLDAADSVYRRWARQRMRSKRLVGLVAEDSRGLVVASGCIWIQPVQPRPGRPMAVVPYLLSMYTEPVHRRSGLATRIVRKAIAWCREHGHTRMTLHAAPQGRGVYRNLGFEKTWEMRVRISAPAQRRKRADGDRSGKARR